MNSVSVAGLLLGIAAVLAGSIIEGGRVGSLVQASAALIVFGGTFGATFLSFSFRDIVRAGQALREVFLDRKALPEAQYVIRDITEISTRSRKNGVLSIEREVQGIQYGFFRRGLRLVIDGVDPKLLRRTLEQETASLEEEKGRAAKVFESAGGFAPTIGIIGAVLGLIHVMENLSNPSELGSGIAVAFVATVYGVGSANLVFIPIAKKIMNGLRDEIYIREIIIEGVLGIQSGKNPFYLREYLNSFIMKR